VKQVEPFDAEKEFLLRVEQEIGDSPLLQELHDFHRYLRDSDLGSGTIVGYLRKMYRNLDEDRQLKDPVDDDILSVVSLCATGGQIVHKNFSLTV